jgi:hypothetical protein
MKKTGSRRAWIHDGDEDEDDFPQPPSRPNGTEGNKGNEEQTLFALRKAPFTLKRAEKGLQAGRKGALFKMPV